MHGARRSFWQRLAAAAASAAGAALATGIALALVMGPMSTVRAAQGLLDGKTFVGHTGQKGSDKGDPDELMFNAGRFSSKSCEPYGFAATPYKATVNDGVVSFVADATSAKEGKMHWTGTVKGDALLGEAVWTKPGQADGHYWLKATLRK